LSPVIVTNYASKRLLKRAFVVISHKTKTIKPTVVLCTQIETLAVYDDDKGSRGELAVYSTSGVLLRGNEVDRNLVLFGRYLCGDAIPQDEEIELLELLKRRYESSDKSSEKAFYRVMNCLVKAQIVRDRAGLLRALHTKENWQDESASASPESEFVDSVMLLTSFGRRYV
jgi:hypothetical protein